MSTFGTMVAEIREELRRNGVDNAIKRAIGAAVIYHRDKRFIWNELSFALTTVADQPDYDGDDDANIDRLAQIDNAKIASPETDLTPRTIQFIRAKVGLTSGLPLDIAVYERAITLSPTPNAVYTINIDGIMELEDLTQPAGQQIISRENILTIADGYTTAWFVEGYEVIKSWAKGYIYQNHLRNSEQAGTDFTASDAFRTDQENKAAKLGSSGFVQPTQF